MTTHRESGTGRGISRRGLLQVGLATAAVTAVGGRGDLLAQDQVSGSKRAGGVPVIDIHAHYFPQAYLDLVAD